jgi:hypothetical protein
MKSETTRRLRAHTGTFSSANWWYQESLKCHFFFPRRCRTWVSGHPLCEMWLNNLMWVAVVLTGCVLVMYIFSCSLSCYKTQPLWKFAAAFSIFIVAIAAAVHARVLPSVSMQFSFKYWRQAVCQGPESGSSEAQSLRRQRTIASSMSCFDKCCSTWCGTYSFCCWPPCLLGLVVPFFFWPFFIWSTDDINSWLTPDNIITLTFLVNASLFIGMIAFCTMRGSVIVNTHQDEFKQKGFRTDNPNLCCFFYDCSSESHTHLY